MPVIPALERLRQEGDEFEASLGYIETLSQKTIIVIITKYFPAYSVDDQCLKQNISLTSEPRISELHAGLWLLLFLVMVV
jgi:hypothetical protein